MDIKDHDIEVLKALWRSRNPEDLCDSEIRVALENVIDILIKMQKMFESSNIYFELNPFESGVLIGVLVKSMHEDDNPVVNNPVVNNIYNRLKDLCEEKYYRE